MSLVADYFAEREGFLIEESDVGFAAYKVEGDECYLKDIYVKPEFRKSGVAKSLADSVKLKAEALGAKYMTGSVDSTLSSATTSVKVLLAYGMRVYLVRDPLIYFIKEF